MNELRTWQELTNVHSLKSSSDTKELNLANKLNAFLMSTNVIQWLMAFVLRCLSALLKHDLVHHTQFTKTPTELVVSAWYSLLSCFRVQSIPKFSTRSTIWNLNLKCLTLFFYSMLQMKTDEKVDLCDGNTASCPLSPIQMCLNHPIEWSLTAASLASCTVHNQTLKNEDN